MQGLHSNMQATGLYYTITIILGVYQMKKEELQAILTKTFPSGKMFCTNDVDTGIFTIHYEEGFTNIKLRGESAIEIIDNLSSVYLPIKYISKFSLDRNTLLNGTVFYHVFIIMEFDTTYYPISISLHP